MRKDLQGDSHKELHKDLHGDAHGDLHRDAHKGMHKDLPADNAGSSTRPLYLEDVLDEDVYKEVWLDVGDDKFSDVAHLIEQQRLRNSR